MACISDLLVFPVTALLSCFRVCFVCWLFFCAGSFVLICSDSEILYSRLVLLDCGSLHGDFDLFDHNLLFGFSDVSFDFRFVLDFDLALFLRFFVVGSGLF